jgi:hypothetical protein
VFEKRVWRYGNSKPPRLNLCLIGSWIKRYIQGEGALWRRVIDAKYNTKNLNILSCHDIQPSTFWKGVMWASRAVSVGYKWKVGDGRSIKFWEDIWFGNSPLVPNFGTFTSFLTSRLRPLGICGMGSRLEALLGGFFPDEMMVSWLELIEIAKTISYSEENDQIIWQYETNGIYSSSSMYAIVNFRGIQPIYLPSMWKLKIPPRIQVFLWLFSQKKIMTRDNLRTRGMVKPLECEMCKELETVKHLMFDCIVARLLWTIVEKVFDCSINNFESIASKWLCNNKNSTFQLSHFCNSLGAVD